MAVVEMRKLTVIGLNSSRTPFIHELMHLGVVEIDSNEGAINEEEWMPDFSEPVTVPMFRVWRRISAV